MSGQPQHQVIREVAATDGGRAFAGSVHGNVYFGTHEPSVLRAPPKPRSTVPFRRDDDFVDRGDVLDQIHQRCSKPAGRAALVGMGGVGKSQLAIEYAHRARAKAEDLWAFWIHASNMARVEAAYREIADVLELPGRQGDKVQIFKLVHGWLSNENNGRWLVIVDNADGSCNIDQEEASVASQLPQSSNGAVLVTSRNFDVARHLTGREKDIISIGIMTELEAEQHLKNQLRKPDSDTLNLVNALGCVPLAITQAAAYINRQRGMPIATYLEKLNAIELRRAMLRRPSHDTRRDEKAMNSILDTWDISFEQIKRMRSSAADLLAFISFCNQRGIPKSLLRASRNSTLTGEGAGLLLDEEFNEDLIILQDFSLIAERNEGGPSVEHTGSGSEESEFQTHGLVQFATRSWLAAAATEEHFWEQYVTTMAKTFPTLPKYATWSQCRALLPHIQSLSEGKPTDGRLDEWFQVMKDAVHYAIDTGQLAQAERLARQSLDECEKRLPPSDLKFATFLWFLAKVFLRRGNHTEAETLLRKIQRQADGQPWFSGAEKCYYLNSLARTLMPQGKHDEAVTLYRQVLLERQRMFGPTHRETLISMASLASALAGQKRYDEAETMLREQLPAIEKELGSDNPDTLISLNALAAILGQQGNLSEAEGMYRRAWMKRAEILGPQSPDTVQSLVGLSGILYRCGKRDEAHELLDHARRMPLSALTAFTLQTMVDLAADIKEEEGLNEEAKLVVQECIGKAKELLGPNHQLVSRCKEVLRGWRSLDKEQPLKEMNAACCHSLGRRNTIG